MRLKVGVLMGGLSKEREVSFNSGRTVCDHLDSFRYEIIPLFQTKDGRLYILPWYFLHRGKISDFESRLDSEVEEVFWDDLKKIVDFIYIAIHGRFAEDGTIQGLLEVLGIPYLGSKVFASALGMDKIMQYQFLAQNNIDVPNYVVVDPIHIRNYNESYVLQKLKKANIGFPCIVKPAREGSSLGVSRIDKAEDIKGALESAVKVSSEREEPVLIEERLEGMEFCSVIMTDYQNNKLKPLPLTEIIIEKDTQIFDYNQKYMPGRAIKYTPARCKEEVVNKIQEVCLKVMEVLGASNILRTDGFLTRDGRVVIIDPNTLTGMSPSSFLFRQAAEINMNHTEVINHLIETDLFYYGLLNGVEKNEREERIKMKNKMRVGVLMGGRSSEKEISLESGRNVSYKLSPQKYKSIPIFVNNRLELYKLDQKLLVMHSTKEIEECLSDDFKIKWSDLRKEIDFAFIALHGGEGENGTIQGALELLNIPYNGSSVLTSALCMNKYKTNQFLKNKGFNVPDSLLITHKQWNLDRNIVLKKIDNRFSMPIILKPSDEGCSFFVKKIKNIKELSLAIDELLKTDKEAVMVEEAMEAMELTVGVIGNNKPNVFPPSQVISSSDVLSIEEKFLPGEGENQTPAKLPKEDIDIVKRVVGDVYRVLNCKGYARIDCFYELSSKKVIILEINSLPGLTPATCLFHQAAEIGIKPMDLIDKIIGFGLEEHGGTIENKK